MTINVRTKKMPFKMRMYYEAFSEGTFLGQIAPHAAECHNAVRTGPRMLISSLAVSCRLQTGQRGTTRFTPARAGGRAIGF